MSSACAVFHACLWLMCQQTLVRLIVGCVCACVRVWGGSCGSVFCGLIVEGYSTTGNSTVRIG